jgi:hypothetical protein
MNFDMYLGLRSETRSSLMLYHGLLGRLLLESLMRVMRMTMKMIACMMKMMRMRMRKRKMMRKTMTMMKRIRYKMVI